MRREKATKSCSVPAHKDTLQADKSDHGRSWFAALKTAYTEGVKDNVGIVAAGVAYYAFLALVPLLGAIVLLYGLVADTETVTRHASVLATTLPQSAASLITDQLEAITQSSAGKKGFGLAVALAFALFGARNGAGGIVTALDIAYDLIDERSFIRKTLLALAITLGAIVGAGIIAAAIAATGLLAGVPGKIASYVVVLASAVLGAFLLFRFAPDREPPAWKHQMPGAILFAIGTLITTAGFAYYVSNFGNYNATYGSLGAVVVLLTWLYLTAYILMIGAELNAPAEKSERERQRSLQA